VKKQAEAKMFNKEETEIISKALDLAATWIATPSWKRRAQALYKAFLDGQWDAEELDFVLTVIWEGRWNYCLTPSNRETLELAGPLRNRLKVAA
jgi:hypothetical protein